MQPFLSSITRIADLERRPFKCHPLPRDVWATGDYVLCEVAGKPGPLYHVELPSGRLCQVFDGGPITGRCAAHRQRSG